MPFIIISTIFKTINSSVDSTRKTLSLFNKDWNTYKTNWQNGLASNGFAGGVKSIFQSTKSVISSEQIQILRAWNNAVKHGCTNQETFNKIISNADDNTKMYFVGLNKSKGSLEGLKNAQNATKASTIGLTIAQTALNMAISVGLTLAISAAIKGFDKMINSAKRASEAADEAFSETSEKVEQQEEELRTLDELISRYKELKKDGTLDVEGRKEVKELQNDIADLVGTQARNLDLVNGKLDDEIKKLDEISAKEAKRAYETATANYNNSQRASQNAAGDDSYMFFDGYAYTGSREKDAEKILKEYGFGNNVRSGGFFGSTLFITDSFDNDMNALEGAQEKADYLQSMIDVLAQNGQRATELYSSLVLQKDKYLGYIDSQQGAANSLVNSWITYSQYFNEELSNITVNSVESFEAYRQKMIEVAKSDESVGKLLSDGTLSEKDLETAVNDFMATSTKFSDWYKQWIGDVQDTSENVDKMTVSLEAFNKSIDGIQSAYSTLEKAESEYNEHGAYSLDTLQELLALEPQYLAMLVNKNGQLVINEESMRKLVEAQLEETKAEIFATGVAKLNALASKESGEASEESANKKSNATSDIDAESDSLQRNTEEHLKNVAAQNARDKGASEEDIQAIIDETMNAVNALESAVNGFDIDFDGTVGGFKDVKKETEETEKEFDKLNKSIDNIQSAYSTLQDALKEKNEHGEISVDTLQSLLELEPQYINMLTDENGNLVLNEEAVNNCTAAYIDNLAAKSALNLIDSVSHLKTEQEQLALLTGEAQQTGDALWNLVAAQLAVVTSSVSPEVGAALTKQVEAIRNMAESAKSGLSMGGLNGFESSQAASDLAEKEKQFAEDMAEAWKEEHLAQLEDDLARRKDIIDRYKESIEISDFGLDYVDEHDFLNRSNLLNDKVKSLTDYGVEMRKEFERITKIIPQTGEEAQALADRITELGDEMRSNISTLRETKTAVEMLRIDAFSYVMEDGMSQLENELNNIDRRMEILRADNKDDFKYTNKLLSMSALLPSYSEFDKERREKQKHDSDMINLEKTTQDTINKVVTDALEQQAKDNAAAREKERQNLIADMEKARQDAAQKLAEAHQDYKDFLTENEIATDESVQNIEESFKNANIELPAVDSTQLEQSVMDVVNKLSNQTIDVTVNVKEGSYQGGSDIGGTSGGVPTSAKVPLSQSVAASPAGTKGSRQGTNQCVKYAYARKKEITGYQGDIWYSGNGVDLGDSSLNGKKIKDPKAYRNYLVPGAIITMTGGTLGHAIVVEGYDSNTDMLWYSDNNQGTTGKKLKFADLESSRNLTGVIPVNVYAKGTNYHPGGLALVGDENYLKGWNKPAPELAIYPDGSGEVLGENGAEIRNLPKGTQVIPAKQTKSLLGNIHSYADGTGDITVTEGETTEIVVKFDFDEWYQNEGYIVDSIDEFDKTLNKFAAAYDNNQITASQVLQGVKLLEEHNVQMLLDYVHSLPFEERAKEGKIGWTVYPNGSLVWHQIPTSVAEYSYELYGSVAEEYREEYPELPALNERLAEAHRNGQEAVKAAHNSLPYAGSTPAYLQEKKDAIEATFGYEWLQNFRGGELADIVPKLIVGSDSWNNLIETKRLYEEEEIDNRYGSIVGKGSEGGKYYFKGIDEKDFDTNTVYGNSLDEMRSSPMYEIDGTPGENAMKAQAEAYRADRARYDALLERPEDAKTVEQLYNDSLGSFDKPLQFKNAIEEYYEAKDSLEKPSRVFLGVYNQLSSEDPSVVREGVDGYADAKSDLDAGNAVLNEKIDAVLASVGTEPTEPTVMSYEDVYGEDDWGKIHPMLRGISPEDVAGGDLSLLTKHIYESRGYDIIVDNSGYSLAGLSDGLSDRELLMVANWLKTNGSEGNKYLGGIAYREVNGQLYPEKVLDNYTGWYGTASSNQWMGEDGNIYQKGRYMTTVTNLSNPSEVTIASNGVITIPEEYEKVWTEKYAQKVEVSDVDDSDTTSSDKSDTDKKTYDDPELASVYDKMDAFMSEMRTLSDNSRRTRELINNREDLTDKEKNSLWYKLSRRDVDAAGEVYVKMHGELYAEFLDYLKRVEEDPDLFNIEVIDAYYEAFDNMIDEVEKIEKAQAERRQVLVDSLNEEIEAVDKKINLADSIMGDDLRALSLITSKMSHVVNAVKEGVLSAKEGYEQLYQYQLEYYNKQKEIYTNELNVMSSRIGAIKTLTSAHYDVINGVEELRHEIGKELNTSMTMAEYLDADTRRLLFNEDDYNTLSNVLNEIEAEANSLRRAYDDEMLFATAETVEQITSEYEMQYELVMKRYEIAKAELDVAKKKKQLENVLNERNVRMFIDGQWQWVANTQDVINAKSELADAEYAAQVAEHTVEQTKSLNQLTTAQNAITTALNSLNAGLDIYKQNADMINESLADIGETGIPSFTNALAYATSTIYKLYDTAHDFDIVQLKDIEKYQPKSSEDTKLVYDKENDVYYEVSKEVYEELNNDSENSVSSTPTVTPNAVFKTEDGSLIFKPTNALGSKKSSNGVLFTKYGKFDDGGIASGKGLLIKDVNDEETVLPPHLTKLVLNPNYSEKFKTLVSGLESLYKLPSINTSMFSNIGKANYGNTYDNRVFIDGISLSQQESEALSSVLSRIIPNH